MSSDPRHFQMLQRFVTLEYKCKSHGLLYNSFHLGKKSLFCPLCILEMNSINKISERQIFHFETKAEFFSKLLVAFDYTKCKYHSLEYKYYCLYHILYYCETCFKINQCRTVLQLIPELYLLKSGKNSGTNFNQLRNEDSFSHSHNRNYSQVRSNLSENDSNDRTRDIIRIWDKKKSEVELLEENFSIQKKSENKEILDQNLDQDFKYPFLNNQKLIIYDSFKNNYAKAKISKENLDRKNSYIIPHLNQNSYTEKIYMYFENCIHIYFAEQPKIEKIPDLDLSQNEIYGKIHQILGIISVHIIVFLDTKFQLTFLNLESFEFKTSKIQSENLRRFNCKIEEYFTTSMKDKPSIAILDTEEEINFLFVHLFSVTEDSINLVLYNNHNSQFSEIYEDNKLIFQQFKQKEESELELKKEDASNDNFFKSRSYLNKNVVNKINLLSSNSFFYLNPTHDDEDKHKHEDDNDEDEVNEEDNEEDEEDDEDYYNFDDDGDQNLKNSLELNLCFLLKDEILIFQIDLVEKKYIIKKHLHLNENNSELLISKNQNFQHINLFAGQKETKNVYYLNEENVLIKYEIESGLFTQQFEFI